MSINAVVLDNTKRAAFRLCKRKYFFQHVRNLQSIYGSTAIRFGVAYHGIQEGFHKHILAHGWENRADAVVAGITLGKEKFDEESKVKNYVEDWKNYNTCVDCFSAYLDYFRDDQTNIKVIGTESVFEIELTPESEEEELLLKIINIPVIFTGRIDLQVQMDEMNWIWDFKTTGWRLDEVVSQSARSPQFVGYSYAAKKSLDFPVSGCLASFAHMTAYKSRTSGEYGSPKFDFRRVPLIFSDGDIIAWKLSFLDTAKDIMFSHQHNLWPESFDNCFKYGACSYLKLCRQRHNELNMEGFYEEEWDVRKEKADE